MKNLIRSFKEVVVPKLVIVSKISDLELGRVYRGLELGPHGYGVLPDQCFRVVAKSTPEAWIECNVAYGSPRDHLEMIVDINGPWYYYEIETD